MMAVSCLHSNRALLINEILSIVLQELKGDFSSLARLARCSKAFLEPVLDILWTEVDISRLVPLFRGNTLLFKLQMVQSVTFDSSEWCRFDTYACRVRTLRVGPYISGIRAYQRVTTFRNVTDVFPKVQKIVLTIDGLGFWPQTTFLPASLRTFQLTFLSLAEETNNAVSLEAILYQLNRDAPLLEELDIRNQRCRVPDMKFLSMAHLHTFQIGFDNRNVITEFSHLLSRSPVTELTITVNYALLRDPDLDLHPTSPMYSMLEKLTVVNSPRLAGNILMHTSSEKLRTLIVQTTFSEYPCDVASYIHLLRVLHASKHSNTLRRLKLYFPTFLRPLSIGDFEVVMDALVPLVEAGSLKELVVVMVLEKCWQKLTPKAQKLIEPSSWPSLEYFRVISPAPDTDWGKPEWS